MRAATALVGIVLAVTLFGAAASGKAPSGLRQTASPAPWPATVQVDCVSATSCVSVGGSFLLVERGGRWRVVKSPLPPSPGKGASVNLRSVACPSSGSCVASGLYGERRAVVVTQSAGWHLGVVDLPEAPADPWPSLTSVSCGSAGECAAVGRYQTGPAITAHPLLVEEHGGTWGAGVDARLPADVVTVPNPDSAIELGGFLSLVSCPSGGSCVAVGTYTRKDAADSAYSQYPWAVAGSGGRWGSGAALALPPDAGMSADGRGGTSPFIGFTGLSCPSAGNCTAVGGYVDRHGAEQGLIVTERNGTWRTAVRAPLPAKAVAGNPPNSLENPLDSVSCAAPADCAAVGWYRDRSGRRHGLLLTERHGTWRASTLVVRAKSPGGVFTTDVACASRGDCTAIGYHASHGKTYGLIAREHRGKWGRGIEAVLPRGAAPRKRSHVFLDSVSCPSAKTCTAVGSYSDRSGKTRGLLLRLR